MCGPSLTALYPRKGAIAVGSDADIVVLDPTRRGKVRAADLHETDYTPWEGHDVFAWPVVTILRTILAAIPDLTIENLTFLRWRKQTTPYIEGLPRAGIPEQ